MDALPAMSRLHLRIEGRVQGVGFREACRRKARVLCLDGWVRNRRDDSVEVMAQGSAQAIADLETWLHRGPPLAKVDRLLPLTSEPHEPPIIRGFELRDTL